MSRAALRCVRRLSYCLGVWTVTNALPARADVPKSTRDQILEKAGAALVRVNRIKNRVDQGHGSGVVVSADPTIVATCYHVVMGAEDLSVRTSVRHGALTYKVKAVATDGRHDLAFLWLDTLPDSVWPQVADWSPLKHSAALVNNDFVGFGFGGFNDWRVTQFVTGGSPLEKLAVLSGGPKPLTLVNPELMVLDFTVTSGFTAGDSGLPIFMGSDQRLVGLGAGSVLAGGSIKHDFAIAIPGALPDKAAYSATKPYLDKSHPLGPYGRSDLVIKLLLNVLAAPPIDPDLAPPHFGRCLADLYALVASYAGRRKELPPQQSSNVPGCAELYADIRPALIEQEKEYTAQEAITVVAEAAKNVELEAERVRIVLDTAASRPEVSDKDLLASLPELTKMMRSDQGTTKPVPKIKLFAGLGGKSWVKLDRKAKRSVTAKLITDHALLSDAKLKQQWAAVASLQPFTVAAAPLSGTLNTPETAYVNVLREQSRGLFNSAVSDPRLGLEEARKLAAQSQSVPEPPSERLTQAAALRGNAAAELTRIIQRRVEEAIVRASKAAEATPQPRSLPTPP